MEFLTNNWYLILAAIAAVIVVVLYFIDFFKKPKEDQIKKVKEWLLYAVMLSESKFGSKTGKIKLRYVYDLFLTKFGWLSMVISFEQFSDLVDMALYEMKPILDSNEKIKELVENGDM